MHRLKWLVAVLLLFCAIGFSRAYGIAGGTSAPQAHTTPKVVLASYQYNGPGTPRTTEKVFNNDAHPALKRYIVHPRVIEPAWSYATASWYDDAGTTASGHHATYGVATCGDQTGVCYPFGTRITFSYHGNSVTAIVDDHGPYANGASFDLNQNTARALGFDGVDTVGYVIR